MFVENIRNKFFIKPEDFVDGAVAIIQININGKDDTLLFDLMSSICFHDNNQYIYEAYAPTKQPKEIYRKIFVKRKEKQNG